MRAAAAAPAGPGARAGRMPLSVMSLVLAAAAGACVSGGAGKDPSSRPAGAPPAPEAVAAPDGGPRTEEAVKTGIPAGDGPLYAALDTSLGRIVVRLYEKEAPRTVANFAELATGARDWTHPATGRAQVGRPLYDNTAFHRVIPNFMIQGGDPLSSQTDGDPARVGSGDPGYRFADELAPGLHFDRPGLLAMANSGPDTNGSQFFITEVATPHLDGRHAIFGEVVQGFEIVPKIARVPAGPGNRPLTPVVLRKVTLSRGSY